MEKINIQELPKIAKGLNIEGYHPVENLPKGCAWYNIVQVIDEPLKGETFDRIIKIKNDNHYDCIEEAVEIDMNVLFKTFIDFITSVINKIKYNKIKYNIIKYNTEQDILVHIHQLKGSTLIGEKLEAILKDTNPDILQKIQIIYDELENSNTDTFDGTSYNVKKVNYAKEYPTIKCLISFSQCAGFGIKPGSWIVPNTFMDFDVKTNTIDRTNQIFVHNHAFDIMKELCLPYVKGNILVVNDLWNPDVNDPINNFVYIK